MTKSKLLQLNNVGIVVESLDNAISFFEELGLTPTYRMCYIRGTEGILIGLAEELSLNN